MISTQTDFEPAGLLKQYFNELDISFQTAIRLNPDAPEDVVSRIEELLDTNPDELGWNIVYKIEQYLVYLYDDASLAEQLRRRLIDFRKHADPERYEHYREHSAKVDERREKQELLRTITSYSQWAYRKRDEQRYYASNVRKRNQWVFAIALAVFAIALLVSHSEWPFGFEYYDFTTRTFIIGICSGFLGACYSMMIRLKTRIHLASLDDLRLFNEPTYILSRPFIGVAAALVLFFLIQSGLIEGSLFPDLPMDRVGDEPLLTSYVNISKMIVWGVIAGFSEYFVPNLMKKAERTAETDGDAKGA